MQKIKAFKKAIILFALSLNANADVLFLNLNGAKEELKVAEEAAKRNGEKFIVLPTAPYDHFNPSNMNEMLSTVEGDITTLIVSGHNGGGGISGTTGNVPDSTTLYNAIMKSAPKLRKSIKNIFLWGCYGATPYTLQNKWGSIFPNYSVIAGFDGSAPYDGRLANSSYMKAILEMDEKLGKDRNLEKIKTYLKQIEHINQIFPSLLVNTCEEDESNKDYYISSKSLRDTESVMALEDIHKSCPAKIENLQKLQPKIFLTYFEGKKAIPKNHHTSDLRMFYGEIRQAEHCFDKTNALRDIYDPARVLFLIYNDQVKDNFFEQYSAYTDQKLSSFNELTREDFENIKKDYKNPAVNLSKLIKIRSQDIKKMNRAEISKYLNGLTEMNHILDSRKALTPISQNIAAIKKVLSNHLYEMTPACIPFGWATTPHSKKTSNCMATQ